MSKITVYQKPTCTTCRNLYKMMTESGVDFDAVDYFVEPLSKSRLTELLKKMGIPAKELLRSKEDKYKELGLAGKDLKDAELVDLMVKYPELMQRPIVEKGDKAILARPAERVKEIL